MNEGQDQSGQLESISLSIAMSKYDDNPLKNKIIDENDDYNQEKDDDGEENKADNDYYSDKHDGNDEDTDDEGDFHHQDFVDNRYMIIIGLLLDGNVDGDNYKLQERKPL